MDTNFRDKLGPVIRPKKKGESLWGREQGSPWRKNLVGGDHAVKEGG